MTDPKSDLDVMIVEDYKGTAIALGGLFKLRGLKAEWCLTMAEALEMIARRPALAVVDLRLSDGDGVDLVPEIQERLPDCRIVVCSGYLDEHVETTLRALGVTDFVHKPMVEEDLDKLVAMLPPREAETDDAK